MAATVGPAVKLFGVFLAVAGAAPNNPALLAYAQNNIISTSKRAVTSGLQIGFGSIGGIAASTLFRQQDAPRYLPGYFAYMNTLTDRLIAMIGCQCFTIVAAGSLAVYFHKMNKRADDDKSVVLEGHEGFRYTT